MNEQNMTTVEAIFNEQVDRRALLVGLLGAGAVAFGGAVHDSLKMPRDGEALQALHAVQAAAAEIAKHGVDGRTTSEETIKVILQRESSSIAEMKVALSEPLEHYATGEGRYASAGANMMDGLLNQIGRCQQYHQEVIAPSAAKQMAEARQAQLDLLEKELVACLGQLADYDPALRLNRPVLG